MIMNQNSFTSYDEQILDRGEKKIYIASSIIFFVFLLACILVLILVDNSYPLIISYVTGSIISVFLFYVTSKRIHETYYLDYQKTVRRIHFLYQFSYMFSFLLLIILMKSYFTIIGLVVGLLLIRIAIIVTGIKMKSKNK